MTNPIFPILPSGAILDSTKYEVSKIDPSMSAQMDGGYSVTRARNTRKPRLVFRVGYTDLSNEDKLTLDYFYDAVRGGSLIFDWIDPPSGNTYSVRLKTAITFKYAGYGLTRHWDCSFELEQA